MTTDRTSWATAVGDVGEGTITVRGYPLEDLIRRLPYSAIVYLTIRGEIPTPAQTRVMDAVLGSIVEHAFYSPTTVAARMIASTTPESVIPGVAGSLLTIGSVTVSPQHSAELMTSAIALQEREGLTAEQAAEATVDAIISDRRRMPGMGHPLHPEGDPRAIALKDVAVANGVWGPSASIFERMTEIFCAKTGRQLPINIDGMLACVMTELGFAPLEMPGVAAISFMPGLIAHAVEEIDSGRKLRVVEGAYTGPAPRAVPDFEYWSDEIGAVDPTGTGVS
jgi:citrate synthase